MKTPPNKIHPQGENQKTAITQAIEKIPVDTYGGRVYINWDHDTIMRPIEVVHFCRDRVVHFCRDRVAMLY